MRTSQEVRRGIRLCIHEGVWMVRLSGRLAVAYERGLPIMQSDEVSRALFFCVWLNERLMEERAARVIEKAMS